VPVVRRIRPALRRGNLGGTADGRQRKHVDFSLVRVHGAWNVLEREMAARVHTTINRSRVCAGHARPQQRRASRTREPGTTPRFRRNV